MQRSYWGHHSLVLFPEFSPSAPLVENSGANMQWQARVTFLEPESSPPCLQRPPKKHPDWPFNRKHVCNHIYHLRVPWFDNIWYHQTKITTKINIRIYPYYLASANHFANNNTTSFLTMGQGTATVGLSCSISFQLKLASKSSMTSEIMKQNRFLFTSHKPFLVWKKNDLGKEIWEMTWT